MGLLKCLGKYSIVFGLRPQSRLFRYRSHLRPKLELVINL